MINTKRAEFGVYLVSNSLVGDKDPYTKHFDVCITAARLQNREEEAAELGGSPFGDMKTRTTPKKNTRNTEGDVAGGAKQGPSPSVSSPSAARASRVQEGSSSAQKPRKRRLDPSFGTELGASSSGSKAVGQAGNPTLTDVADPDAALQSSIAGDGRSGGEGSPDHFYEAPLPSQSHGIADFLAKTCHSRLLRQLRASV